MMVKASPGATASARRSSSPGCAVLHATPLVRSSASAGMGAVIGDSAEGSASMAMMRRPARACVTSLSACSAFSAMTASVPLSSKMKAH